MRRSGWNLTLVIAVIVAVVSILEVSQTARYVAVSTAAFVLYGVPSDKDLTDAEAARQIILIAHPFAQNSISRPDRPPVFITIGSSRLLTNPTIIQIYEVEGAGDQDSIENAVKGVITARQAKPIELHFFEHENWNVDGNVSLRGPEKLLRRVQRSVSRK